MNTSLRLGWELLCPAQWLKTRRNHHKDWVDGGSKKRRLKSDSHTKSVKEKKNTTPKKEIIKVYEKAQKKTQAIVHSKTRGFLCTLTHSQVKSHQTLNVCVLTINLCSRVFPNKHAELHKVTNKPQDGAFVFWFSSMTSHARHSTSHFFLSFLSFFYLFSFWCFCLFERLFFFFLLFLLCFVFWRLWRQWQARSRATSRRRRLRMQ